MITGMSDPARNGLLPLGGALRVPRMSLSEDDRRQAEWRENWAQPYPHPFQRDLAAVINLADTYADQSAATANAATGINGLAGAADPIDQPAPLWALGLADAAAPHKSERRSVAESGQLGTSAQSRPAVPRAHWIRYAGRAETAGRIDGGRMGPNRRCAGGESTHPRLLFAQQVAFVWHRKQLAPLIARDPQRALTLTSPIQSRVMSRAGTTAVTVKARLAASATPPVIIGAPMRRLTRPRARMMRALPFDSNVRPDNLMVRVNSGEVRTAPVKSRPTGAIGLDEVVDTFAPSSVPGGLAEGGAWKTFVPLHRGSRARSCRGDLRSTDCRGRCARPRHRDHRVALQASPPRTRRRCRARERDTRQRPSTRCRSAPTSRSPSRMLLRPLEVRRDGVDGAESARFKSALKDLYSFTQAGAASDTVGENGPVRAPLDLTREARNVIEALDPAVTIARRAASLVKLPPRVRAEQVTSLAEVMAYPVFDLPMYKPLAELSAELLIPNVNLIESNSITLLETHQRFIEAYLVGPQPRVRARAAVARVSDRSARQLLPAVLGRLRFLCRAASGSGCAARTAA